MITGWLLELVATVWEWALSTIPVPSEDSWLSTVGDAVAWLVDALAGLGAWIPWALIGAILGTLVAVWLVGVVIRLLRIALALFTGGGGTGA